MFSLELVSALTLTVITEIREDLRDSSVSGGSLDSVLRTSKVQQERLQIVHFVLKAVILHHGSLEGRERGEAEADGEQHRQEVHDVRGVSRT